MKGIKILAFSLAIGLVLTGCGKKEETTTSNNDNNTPVTTSEPFKLDITNQSMIIYGPDGQIIDETIIELDRGYTIKQSEEIISISTNKEDDKNYLIATGKKSGNAELTVYTFDPEDKECTGYATYVLHIDSNLNVTQTGIDASMGSCDKDYKDVTAITA